MLRYSLLDSKEYLGAIAQSHKRWRHVSLPAHILHRMARWSRGKSISDNYSETKKFKYLRLIYPTYFDGFSITDKSNKDAFVYHMGHDMTKGTLQLSRGMRFPTIRHFYKCRLGRASAAFF